MLVRRFTVYLFPASAENKKNAMPQPDHPKAKGNCWVAENFVE
jgi:putative IMPACT (imprinted ancient) family translation regulator